MKRKTLNIGLRLPALLLFAALSLAVVNPAAAQTERSGKSRGSTSSQVGRRSSESSSARQQARQTAPKREVSPSRSAQQAGRSRASQSPAARSSRSSDRVRSDADRPSRGREGVRQSAPSSRPSSSSVRQSPSSGRTGSSQRPSISPGRTGSTGRSTGQVGQTGRSGSSGQGGRSGSNVDRGSTSSRSTGINRGSGRDTGASRTTPSVGGQRVDRGGSTGRTGNSTRGTISRGTVGARGSTLSNDRSRSVASDRRVNGNDRRTWDNDRRSYGNDRRVIGNRGRFAHPDFRPYYHSTRWDRRTWYPRYWWRPPVRVYTSSYLRVRWPRIHMYIDWPWMVRYERRWAPVYRYRQTYRIEVGWGDRREWSNIQVETVYSHQVRYASDDRAEIDIAIDRIEIYDGDRYLGFVDDLPAELSMMSATVYRNGEVSFDRDIFLIGDPYVGFEVVATRAYDGWVMDDYRVEDGYRAGRVDLDRHRVDTIRRSRLFDPDRRSSLVPVSLLPDRDGWLWDYGVEALSSSYDDYDYYYGGSGRSGTAPYAGTDPLTQEDEWSFRTESGADLRFDRQSSIQRVR